MIRFRNDKGNKWHAADLFVPDSDGEDKLMSLCGLVTEYVVNEEDPIVEWNHFETVTCLSCVSVIQGRIEELQGCIIQ